MAKRLDFEDALLKDLQRVRRDRPTVKLRWVVVLFAVGAAVAASASALLTLFSGNSRAHLAETAGSFVGHIANNEIAAAAELCAEGALGAQLIAAERARAFRPGALIIPESDPVALEGRMVQLERIRADLERAGLDWSQAQAVAFGGVSARVMDPVLMHAPSSAIIGNIYLTDGRGVYAIEVSLKECLGSYVITDVWQWGSLDVVPDAVRRHSRAQFQAFRNEEDLDGIRFKRPSHVFVRP